MKKIFLALCLLIVPAAFFAKDKTINVSNLPSGITLFVKKYYPSAKITKVSQESDDKDYNLKLSDGSELEFSQAGMWSEIKTKTSIPAGILPQGILDHVKKAYPGRNIKSIEHSKAGYDIRLNNNKAFQLDNQFRPTKFKEDID